MQALGREKRLPDLSWISWVGRCRSWWCHWGIVACEAWCGVACPMSHPARTVQSYAELDPELNNKNNRINVTNEHTLAVAINDRLRQSKYRAGFAIYLSHHAVKLPWSSCKVLSIVTLSNITEPTKCKKWGSFCNSDLLLSGPFYVERFRTRSLGTLGTPHTTTSQLPMNA